MIDNVTVDQKKFLYVYPKFSFLLLRCADVIAMHSSVYIIYLKFIFVNFMIGC